MQYQMSSAPAPNPGAGRVEIAPAPPGPVIVPQGPGQPGRLWLILAGIAVVVVLGAIAFYVKSGATKPAAATGGPVAIRTAAIGFGDLEQSIRLTGVIQAERFAALMVPRLRGNRGNRGRTGTTNASTAVSIPAVTSLGESGVSTVSADFRDLPGRIGKQVKEVILIV